MRKLSSEDKSKTATTNHRKRSRSRDRSKERKEKAYRRRSTSRKSESDSYSYSDYSSSSYSDSPPRRRSVSPLRRCSCLLDVILLGINRDIPLDDVKDSRPIRERLPLPDLGMMRRMMQNIHKSNQNAEIRDKSASQRKLEVGN